MSTNPRSLAQRKALLLTQAEIDRTRLALAAGEVRQALQPARMAGPGGGSRLVAAGLVGLALPILGVQRSLRAVRLLSFAMTIYRVAGGLFGRR